ncbi:hypothetical protein [Deinococcus apachensis]|uniref:hypothetical protein n=1 Tax=Deinococcus apachensis TaxID=309886 RepID=UPI0003738364|nr:hypothetical protein [Deinococcus apachensis]
MNPNLILLQNRAQELRDEVRRDREARAARSDRAGLLQRVRLMFLFRQPRLA